MTPPPDVAPIGDEAISDANLDWLARGDSVCLSGSQFRSILARIRAAEAGQQWRPISEAPRDGTPIMVAIRSDVAAADDWNHVGWNGRYVVVQHQGFTKGGINLGWSVAAPVGYGGLPDRWMLGWMPLPPAARGRRMSDDARAWVAG